MTDEAQDPQAATPPRQDQPQKTTAQPDAEASAATADPATDPQSAQPPQPAQPAEAAATHTGGVHETPAAAATAHESASKLQGDAAMASNAPSAAAQSSDDQSATEQLTVDQASSEVPADPPGSASSQPPPPNESLAAVVAEPAPASIGASPAGGTAAPPPHIPDVRAESLPPAVAEGESNNDAGTQDAAEPKAEAASESTTEAPEAPAADDRPSDRLRERMTGQAADRAVGSEDIRSQRPDVPTNIEPVEIPDVDEDELDASLQAEISSALGEEISSKPTATATQGDAAEGASADAGNAAGALVSEEVGPGSQVSGTVQHIHGDDVFLNAGVRSDIVVSLKQFPEGKAPAVGDSLSVVIESDDEGLFRARLPQARTKSGGDWDALAVGQVVDCVVSSTNKGGLQVTVSNLKGFLPASQVDLGFVADLEQYVGQKLTVQITEVKPKKRNLVVSRKVLLQAEREAQQAGFWESLEVGQDLSGSVKTIKNYGAFVNLGPIDGFLHIGEISWSRINHPNEVLKEGQEIQVRVLKIDKEKNRISLGMKQLIQNPWLGLSERYPTERVVSGKVTRVADFGAFVELEPGVEGLVHISQLAWRRVGSVNEVLSVGDEKDFQVLEVDQKRKRVSLSLKALEKRPESAHRSEPDHEPRPPRKENPDLRGGTGSSGGGGLFGNPSDFS